MERSIGEIFEYEDSKYQIVEAITDATCEHCAGAQNSHDSSLCTKGIGRCIKGARSDRKDIIAVRLDK